MAKDDGCIKVLMVGARRCGKSTLLASLVSSAVTGLKDILTVQDVTEYASGEATLKDKSQDLRSLFSNLKPGVEVSLDTGATNAMRDYKIEVKIPKYSGSTNILFTDVNGEYFHAGNQKNQDMKERVAQYDIILVAIDTTFLMGDTVPGNKMCTPVINKLVNQLASVDGILKNLDDADGQVPRQVIFCPIKAERWIQEGKFNLVLQRFQQVYAVTLKALMAYKNVEILVLPVQTVGGLSFTKHRTGQILTTKATKRGFVQSLLRLTAPTAQMSLRCSPSDNDASKVLVSTGEVYTLKPEDVVQPDPRAKVSGIFTPFSWFKVLPGGYQPRGCDLLAYHVLRFTLARTLDAKQREKANNKMWTYLKRGVQGVLCAFGGLVGVALAFLLQKWGTINLDALSDSLKKIKALTAGNDKTVFLKKSLITD